MTKYNAEISLIIEVDTDTEDAAFDRAHELVSSILEQHKDGSTMKLWAEVVETSELGEAWQNE